jgi:SAM-dependent methyltransferase
MGHGDRFRTRPSESRAGAQRRLQASRREPRPWEASYLLLHELAERMRQEADRRLAGRDVDVVDIGCGVRPYEPDFRPYARSYTAVDAIDGYGVDVVAPAESLPFADSSFDVALCIQVLEHAEDPWGAAREISRVVRPGGVAFVSTHGTARYHTSPEEPVEDYWRWTHAGLERLLRVTGDWEEVHVFPTGGTGAALAYVLGRELEIVFAKLRLPFAALPVNLALNVVGGMADRWFSRAYPGRQPDLAPNYLAVAVRPG